MGKKAKILIVDGESDSAFIKGTKEKKPQRGKESIKRRKQTSTYDIGRNRSARLNLPVRALIYIPIIHTRTDMGTLGDSIQRITIQKSSRQAWKRKMDTIGQLWTQIERTIDALPLSCKKVRLYQDGLPVCGCEAEIVKNLAEAGSRNHQLLLGLMEKGAAIMGTESSELLVEEYQLVKQSLAAKDTPKSTRPDARRKVMGQSLLEKRDQYIADRINGTLRIGETGILFIGMLHSVEKYLHKDIRVRYPIRQAYNQ